MATGLITAGSASLAAGADQSLRTPDSVTGSNASPLPTYTAHLPSNRSLTSGFQRAPSVSQNLGSFNINLSPDAGLSANQPALDAFERAANQWEEFISDPITVNIDAGLDDFSADNDSSNDNVIGQTGSVTLSSGYTSVRNSLVADASNELAQPNGFDDSITGDLPTASNFSATVPTGTSLTGQLSGTKANFKAIGFTGLNSQFGNTDATITFNSAFNFDYDNRDGIDNQHVDFETTATHEIGHALGFTSEVDNIDNGDTQIDPSILDLFRFADDVAGQDPASTADFTAFARDLAPGDSAVLDDIVREYQLSTGVNNGDGRQASHWKDNGLTGNLIGILDPTLGAGQVFPLTDADRRALDLIGYEVIPEPTTLALLGLGSVVLFTRRRQDGSRARLKIT